MIMEIALNGEKLVINASSVKETLELLRRLEEKYGLKIEFNIVGTRCG